MKTYRKFYSKLCSYENLFLAYKKARKGKTKRKYVIEFEKNLKDNLLNLQRKLMDKTYKPKPLKKFIIRDPKTRKIYKSAFIDRIVHHAIINVLEPIYEKIFIYDSYANRKGKGNLKAVERFRHFMMKVTNNGEKLPEINDNNYVCGYVLKADIVHYFNNVNHEILIKIIKRKIRDDGVIWLINKILNNYFDNLGKGMPLGNLTSQFFANVYLNDLDYFVKHKLKARYYIRYVDDFVILHSSKEQLVIWKKEINEFLRDRLKIELHSEKSRIVPISRGIDFVGFRNFYYFRLLRRRNIRNIRFKILLFVNGDLSFEEFLESFQGWLAYARWADICKLKGNLFK